MLKINSVTLVAVSSIDGIDVAHFSADIQSTGRTNISKNISDRQMYLKNKETVEADYDDFETRVEEYIKGV